MYKIANARITEADHEWLKAQKKKDARFKQIDFMGDAIAVAIQKAKKGNN
tara:strand:- start:13037 stop:13186 length:150 start_codon:yes stop_codon:yes gene_type:complete